MSQLAESKGLILSSRNYKEKDELVKISTESSGKTMFCIEGVHRQNQPLTPALPPFTEAVYIGNFRSEGLSFSSSVKDVHVFRYIQGDIFLSSCGTYLLNLVDVIIKDHQYDSHLFQFTQQILQQMDQGDDAKIVTNIFEVQILQHFRIMLIWTHYVVYEEAERRFDYPSKYGSVVCERH